MASATIYTTSSKLSWNSSTVVTSLTHSSSTTVTNSSGGTVYWWSGTGDEPAGNTNTVSTSGTSFNQGATTQSWSFATSNASGTKPQITLKVTGKGGDEEL